MRITSCPLKCSYKQQFTDIWYNKKHIFGLRSDSWYRASKTFSMSWMVKVIGASFVIHKQTPVNLSWVYANEDTLDEPLASLVKDQPCDQRAGTLSLHHLWGGERSCRLHSTSNGLWFNDPCLCNEASITTPNNVVWRASRLVTTSRCWEGAEPERAGAPHPALTPCPGNPPHHWSWVISFIINQKESVKQFPEFCRLF